MYATKQDLVHCVFLMLVMTCVANTASKQLPVTPPSPAVTRRPVREWHSSYSSLRFCRTRFVFDCCRI